MKIELIIARGLTILIDGIKPSTEYWSFGEDDKTGRLTITEARSSKKPVKIGKIKVQSIGFDIPFREMMDSCIDPKEVVLFTTNGEIHAKVLMTCAGDPNAIEEDEETHVTLTDGTDREISEVEFYILAESV
jgi:hypothetical protein